MNNIDYKKIPAGFPLDKGPVTVREDGRAYPCGPGETPDAVCTVPCTTGFVGAIAPISENPTATKKDK